MKLVSVAEMVAIEREADAAGLTYEKMMENAGCNLATIIEEELIRLGKSSVLGLVGSGNNGGDTLVALSELLKKGWICTVYLARPRVDPDPLQARFKKLGGKIIRFNSDDQYGSLSILIHQHDFFIDGVLGTGLRLPLKHEIAEVLRAAQIAINHQEKKPYVIAVDCPSGMDCDLGITAPECISANLTVTMAAVKQGLLKFPAYSLVGKLCLVGIGLEDLNMNLSSWQEIHRYVATEAMVRKFIPERLLDSHKGDFGSALILAGSLNYTGAAYLAGKAAQRTGVGLVTLAIPRSIHNTLAGHLPDATWLPLPEEGGFISADAAPVICQNLDRTTTLLFGPGFGLEETTTKFLSRLLGYREQEQSKLKDIPMVIDADGLKLLTRIPEWWKHISPQSVLTPHPGEMALLTGLSTSTIQTNRLQIAEQFSTSWGHIVVLKGAMTVIATPSGVTTVIPIATSALAHAGTGDVLAGLITGYLAQGLLPAEAAIVGAYIHAQSGLLAAEQAGSTAPVLASDLLDSCKEVIAKLG